MKKAVVSIFLALLLCNVSFAQYPSSFSIFSASPKPSFSSFLAGISSWAYGELRYNGNLMMGSKGDFAYAYVIQELNNFFGAVIPDAEHGINYNNKSTTHMWVNVSCNSNLDYNSWSGNYTYTISSIIICLIDAGNSYKYEFSIPNVKVKSGNFDDHSLYTTLIENVTRYVHHHDRQFEMTTKRVVTPFTERWFKENVASYFQYPLAGIYEDVAPDNGGKDNKYKLGLTVVDGKYYLIYLSGCNMFDDWKEGDMKASLEPTATPNVFRCTWLTLYKTEKVAYVNFEPGLMTIVIDGEKDSYIKLFPTTAPGASSSSVPQQWSGTGFAIGNGYIVTNHHVVEDAKTIVVKGLDGDFATEYEAEVIASDRISDLSIIAIKSPKSNSKVNLPYKVKTTLSDVGEDVFVLGYPLTATMGDEIKLTTGVVSSRSGFQGDVSLYQISAPVQPGNSGGPLFDNNGNVIGIVSAKHTGAENVGYAIKTSYLKNLMESAGINAALPASNTISSLPLSGKVKAVKNHVYMIVCSSSGNGTIPNTPTNSVQTNAEPNQSGVSQGGCTIHNPRVERNNSGGSTEILSVTIGTTYTAVELKYKNTKYIGGWCSIDKKTHIVADGKSYIMSRADGISYSPHTTSLEIGQSIIFTLYFPSIPSSVTKIDLVEPGSSSWQFYGINVQ